MKKRTITIVLLILLSVTAILSCNVGKYKIEFIVDGKVYASKYTKGNEEISLPPQPQSKEGLEFEGWYFDDETFENKFKTDSFKNERLTQNVHVFAKFIPKRSLSFELINDGFEYAVIGIGTITDSELVIPSEYEGKKVTRIDGFAFEFLSGIKKVVISEGIKEIGNSAFRSCNNLSTVSIPNSVIAIGNNAFSLCSALLDLNIPKSVEKIGSGAFSNCSALTAINVSEQNANFCSKDGVLFDKSGKTLLAYPAGKTSTVYTTPVGTKSIGVLAFIGNNNIENVIISEGASAIEASAFRDFTNLTSVTIADSVKKIGEKAFLNSGIWNSTTNNGVVYADCWAVGYKGSFSQITLLSTTKGISDVAFYGFEALSSISLSENLEIIGNEAFMNCVNLLSVTFPHSLASMGEYAFFNCQSLSSVTFSGNSQLQTISAFSFAECVSLESIALAEGIKNIEYSSFSDCTALTNITLPQSLIYVGSNAFKNSGLWQGVTNDVVYADDWAIGYSGAIDLVTLRTGTRGIGSYAFEGCESLKSLIIPRSVVSIGSGIVYGCNNIESLIIPSSVELLRDSVIYNSNQFTVYVENGVNQSNWNTNWNNSTSIIQDCVLSFDASYLLSFTKSAESVKNQDKDIFAPFREGYIFNGWTTAYNGTTVEYSVDEIESVADGTTLYAIWQSI